MHTLKYAWWWCTAELLEWLPMNRGGGHARVGLVHGSCSGNVCFCSHDFYVGVTYMFSILWTLLTFHHKNIWANFNFGIPWKNQCTPQKVVDRALNIFKKTLFPYFVKKHNKEKPKKEEEKNVDCMLPFFFFLLYSIILLHTPQIISWMLYFLNSINLFIIE